MTRVLEIDFETRSPVDLKVHGAYVYFEHPDTDAMIASYMLDDDGIIRRWRLGEPCPPAIREAVEAGCIIWGHNVSFERLAWTHILAPRHGWPQPRLEQFRCTAAVAAAMGLPRDLAGLSQALGLADKKDDEGRRLMLRMSKPRKPRKDEPDGLYWYGWDDPATVERLHLYCDQDVRTEAAARRRMVPLSPSEQELYWLDQRINDRGIRLDRLSAAGAVALAEKAKAVLDREMALVTAGYVRKCSAVADLTRWVREQGVELDTLGKADVVDLLEADDLPERVRRALEIRQEAAKTSVKKIDAMRARACRDGRIRGSFLFCAAGTGRWSSTGAQLHNMPRPRKVFEDAHVDYRLLFEKIRTGDPEQLRDLS